MGVKVNMNNIKLISSAVAIAIGLSACQTNKESITANPQIVYQTNTVSQQIEQIPEWYLNIPSADWNDEILKHLFGCFRWRLH